MPGAWPVADAAGFDAVEDRDLIVRRLALLTARERAVIVLRYCADLTESDVAATSSRWTRRTGVGR